MAPLASSMCSVQSSARPSSDVSGPFSDVPPASVRQSSGCTAADDCVASVVSSRVSSRIGFSVLKTEGRSLCVLARASLSSRAASRDDILLMPRAQRVRNGSRSAHGMETARYNSTVHAVWRNICGEGARTHTGRRGVERATCTLKLASEDAKWTMVARAVTTGACGGHWREEGGGGAAPRRSRRRRSDPAGASARRR